MPLCSSSFPRCLISSGLPTLHLHRHIRIREPTHRYPRAPTGTHGPCRVSMPYSAAPAAGPGLTAHVRDGLPWTDRPQARRTPPRSTGLTGPLQWEIEAKNGLPSADRNNKATLPLTGPFRTAKSYAKDLTPLVFKLQFAKYHGTLLVPRSNRLLRL